MSDIIFDGPFFQSTSPGTVRLFSAEESDTTRKTNAQQDSIPGEDEDSALLAPLSGQESVSFSGRTIDIQAQELYSGDPYEALRTWIFNFESLVLPQQGSGYSLQHPVEDIIFEPSLDNGVLIEDASWTVEGGRPTAVSWDLEARVSTGTQKSANRLQYVADQQNREQPIFEDKFVVGGNDIPLGSVESKTRTRSVNLNISEMLSAFSEDLPSVGVIESGVEGEFTFTGKLTAKDGDTAQLAQTYSRNLHGETVEFYDSFSNRIFQGAVSQTNTSETAGRTDVVDYRVTFKIGESFV